MADDNEDKSSKTQEPTEKKIRDARKKGDVPNSRETGNLMVVLSLGVITVYLLQTQVPAVSAALTNPIEFAGVIDVGVGETGILGLSQVMGTFVRSVFLSVLPIFGAMMLAAIIGVLIQGSFVVSLERIKPKLSKISPMQGLKRLFSANTVVEFIKNVLKVSVVVALAAWVTERAVQDIWESLGFLPENLPAFMNDAARRLLLATAAFLVPITIADILWKRYDWHTKQMMSVKEIRDEIKESEGDPHLKGKRAAIRQEKSRQRMATVVPTSTVILANPTHYSIALKYEQGVDTAPVCVAKGTDHMALHIRRLASENDVPIVENKALTRSLYQVVEVGDMIPPEHWQVVAEIIGFLIDLQENRVRKLPSGSTLIS